MTDSQLATLLALTAACMHASWNAVMKHSGDRLSTMAAVDLVALLLSLLCVPFLPWPSTAVWTLIGASVLLNSLYRYLLVRAYHLGDFGQVYPLVRGLPPLLVAGLAGLWLGEYLSPLALAGVAIICAGILSLLHGHGHWRASLTAMGAGLCTAGYTLVDARGVRLAETALQYAAYFTLALSLPVPLLAAARRGRALATHCARQWKPSLFGGLTYSASYALVLVAMRLDSVAKVAALRESSVVIASVIATLVFKERFGLRRLIAALLVAVGVGVVRLG